jgi:hypothetical protein
MRLHVVWLIAALLFIPIALWSLVTVWQATAFFHEELIHHSKMALGDARELTLEERMRWGLVWLPWFGLAGLSVWLSMWIVKRCRSAKSAD